MNDDWSWFIIDNILIICIHVNNQVLGDSATARSTQRLLHRMYPAKTEEETDILHALKHRDIFNKSFYNQDNDTSTFNSD